MTHLDEFIATIARLRGPDGCPWDKEQDHLSLGRYLLEETYEVLEAMHAGEPHRLREELGDLLLQIVLNAQIAKDNGQFDIQDIAESINQKMIKRHPHVFATAEARDAKEVAKQWEDLKAEEMKAKKREAGSVVDSVSNTLPALLKALKVSEKAVGVGFEWESLDELWQKLLSELEELKHELTDSTPSNRKAIELELGDVLFVMVNIARWQKMNPEESLLLAINKFRRRFRAMEQSATTPLKELTPPQWQTLWEQAKLQVG